MVSEPLAGKRSVSVQDSHNRLVWASIVADIVENQYSDAERVTLIQDNLSAHKPYAMYELFAPERAKAILDKIEFVYTPKHGSWLNMAEIELSILSRQCTNQRIASKEELIAEIALWETQRNALEATIDCSRLGARDCQIAPWALSQSTKSRTCIRSRRLLCACAFSRVSAQRGCPFSSRADRDPKLQ